MSFYEICNRSGCGDLVKVIVAPPPKEEVLCDSCHSLTEKLLAVIKDGPIRTKDIMDRLPTANYGHTVVTLSDLQKIEKVIGTKHGEGPDTYWVWELKS